jgi:predicted RNA-binding Zn-ribbon protein involved in translation (DUF1610 family)
MSRKRFYIQMLIILALGILGILLEHDQHVPGIDLHIPGHTLYAKIGEAFIVATILAISVDSFLKREFADETLKKVATYFVGYRLPSAVIHELESIRSTQIYLEGMTLDFELAESSKNDCLLLTVKASYRIRNRSSDEQRYTHVIACQKPRHGEQNTIVTVGATGVVIKDNPRSNAYSYTESEIDEAIAGIQSNPERFPADISDVVRDNELWKAWAKEVIIVPESDGVEGGYPQLWGTSMQEVPREGYHPHFLTRPVIGLTYSLRSYVPDIKMVLFAAHRRRTPTQIAPNTYLIDVAFLPWQAVMLKWWRSDPTTVNVSTVPPLAQKKFVTFDCPHCGITIYQRVAQCMFCKTPLTDVGCLKMPAREHF